MNLIIEIEEESETAFVVHARMKYARLKETDYDGAGCGLYKKGYIAEADFLIESGDDQMAGYARSCYTYVSKQFRNTGIATKMYYAALSHVKCRGYRGIYSCLRISNECDLLWEKLRTKRVKGFQVFHKI